MGAAMTALVYVLLVTWIASVSIAAWREAARVEREIAALEEDR